MKKKRVIAVIFMIAAILVAAPLGVHQSLSGIRREAIRLYTEDSLGVSIEEELKERASTAINFADFSKKYEDVNPKLTESAAALFSTAEYVKTNCGKIAQLSDLDERNDQMTEEFGDLYGKIANTEIKETDEPYPQRLSSEMHSRQDIIERSEYNAKALEYNEKLEEVPIGLLSKFAFLEPLSTFD